ncbi:class I SAM-dependent methyltransferase [Crocosphaera sp. Alani8]|uniref:class I SAM-dependent methyltransferase n=1 Tax=Crocosphaera sp. Alani8 TaxID=3038952 RepID=UPI00313AEF97
MLSFITRLKKIKNLIIAKIDKILLNQLRTEETIKLLPEISADQRTQTIILNKHSRVLEEVKSLLQENLEKTSLSSHTLPNKTTETDQQETKEASPIPFFQADFYQRINQRRLEHLASLNLPIADSTVLEVGAGIGDHTSFFTDRGCQIVSTESRPENLDVIRSRYPKIRVEQLDLDYPKPEFQELFDIVYCYGLLYHLKKPAEAIAFMAKRTPKMLLLETCVSFGEKAAVNFCEEPTINPTQSSSGTGCRPTRIWIYEQLKQHFQYVYLPLTQPNHEQFPIKWDSQNTQRDQWDLARSIFIASHQALSNPLLTEELLSIQEKH